MHRRLTSGLCNRNKHLLDRGRRSPSPPRQLQSYLSYERPFAPPSAQCGPHIDATIVADSAFSSSSTTAGIELALGHKVRDGSRDGGRVLLSHHAGGATSLARPSGASVFFVLSFMAAAVYRFVMSTYRDYSHDMLSPRAPPDGLLLIVDKPAALRVHRGPEGGASLLRTISPPLRFGLPRPPALVLIPPPPSTRIPPYASFSGGHRNGT